MNNKRKSPTPKKKKSPKFVPISEEDLIEAGIIVKKPKIEEIKAGTSIKEPKYLEYDRKYLEELQREAARNYDLPPKGFQMPKSVSSQRLSNSVNRMKRTSTISHRKSDANKHITEKAVENIGKVLNGGNKFIPMFQDFLDVKENERNKSNVRKALFGKFRSSIGQNVKSTPQYSGKLKSPSSMTQSNSPLRSGRKLKRNTPLRLSTVKEERQSLTPSENGSTSSAIDSEDVEFEAMEKMYKTQELHEEIEKVLEIIVEYKKFHEEKMLEISQRLKNIIAKVEPVEQPKITKKTSIPSNGENLRKNVLVMNAVKSQVETPKHKKAEKMYNSLREQYGMLETPRFDKKVPTGESNISLKLLEQCLMLSDTPQHK